MNAGPLLLLGLLIIALTPSPYFEQVNVNQPNLHTIRFIQSLKIDKTVNLLQAEGGYHIYVSDNFHRVAEYKKNTDFDRFLQMRSINMIVLSPTLLNDTRFKDDPEWHDFLADYTHFGFVQIDIPHTNRKLFVRADLLDR